MDKLIRASREIVQVQGVRKLKSEVILGTPSRDFWAQKSRAASSRFWRCLRALGAGRAETNTARMILGLFRVRQSILRHDWR